ncbi:MAG: response regulator [Pseudomonas sp.]
MEMHGNTQVLAVESRTIILVAEDHRESREALRVLFEAFGYQVVEAANGRDAVAVALQTRPNLILMDVMMPEMDGCEATRTLRQMAETENIPIIAVTAIDSNHDMLAAGADDYVRKPVDLRHLIGLVSRWMAHEATERGRSHP